MLPATFNQILDGKIFHISKYLPSKEAAALQETVKKLGGSFGPLSETTNYHILPENSNIRQPIQFTAILGTPKWLKSCFDHLRLLPVTGFNPSCLFNGTVIHCFSDISEQDADLIYGAIVAFGGMYEINLSSSVTHIVTLHNVESENQTVKVILPHYFDDCFRLDLRLAESNYLFPEPRIHHLSPEDMVANVTNKACNPVDDTHMFLEGQHLYTVKLNLVLVNEFKRFGGKIESSYSSKVTMLLVGEIKDSAYYNDAVGAGIFVGNVRWLQDMLNEGTIIDPSRRILHTPRSMSTSDIFKGFVISISNYSGQPRDDLFHMAEQLGAKVTKNMTKANTHLISCSPSGSKYEKARQWNLHVVNHLWLEESFSLMILQRESHPRYIHFPIDLAGMVNRVNVVCEMNLDPVKIALSITNEPNHIEEHISVLAEDATRNISMEKLSSMESKQDIPLFLAIKGAQSGNENKRAGPQFSVQKTKKMKCDVAEQREPEAPLGSPKVPQIIVCCTGLSKETFAKKQSLLQDLRINFTEDPSICTHLIAPNPSQTEKFLVATLRNIPILHPKWLFEVINTKGRIESTPFEIVHPKPADSRRIFQDYRFYLSPSITPSLQTTRKMIEAAGGKVIIEII